MSVPGPRPLAADATTVVAVTVVAFNSRESIGRTVADALATPECTTVVVVDNGPDGSADAAEAAGAMALSRPDNPGFGASQNLAVSTTTEPFLLLLNPDAVLLCGAIGAGLDVLLADERIAAVQGVITSRRTGGPERSMGPDLSWKHLWGRALAMKRLLSTRIGRQIARLAGVGDTVERVPTDVIEVETLAATALLIRRSAFLEVGGFDPNYFLYGEDLDLCRRLRASGWRLLGLPVPWASHDDGSTAADMFERELTWWRGTMRYAASWWKSPAWAAAVAASGMQFVRMAISRPRSVRRSFDQLIARPIDDRRMIRPGVRGSS